MASAIEQSRLNLKNVIRSMSTSEISSLTQVFSKQIGIDIEKSVKAISPKCTMVTISMEKERISGYGRSEEEASLNAFKNFMEAMIDKDDMIHPLSASLSKMRDGYSRSRKPPKGRNDLNGNNSFMHTSLDKGSLLSDKIKGLHLQSETDKSRQNESTDGLEQAIRQKPRGFLGRSFMESDADRSRIEGNTSSMQGGKSRTPDRALYVHETHDCLYRSKYKKYKEETHKLSILVDQLQKKLKKYHDENKSLKERLSEAESNAYPANPSFKSKAVEGSILKDSLNKSMNYKNIMQSFTPTDELSNSQKKLYNCQSFQDLKTKAVEKENFKFKEPTKDFGFDENSPSKMSPAFPKSAQQKKVYNIGPSEKGNGHESFHENGRNTIEVGNLIRDSYKTKHSSQAMVAETSEKPSPTHDSENKRDSPHGTHNASINAGSGRSPTDKDKSGSGGDNKRLSVPKLRLETLPNYHGKFNKSINHLFNK